MLGSTRFAKRARRRQPTRRGPSRTGRGGMRRRERLGLGRSGSRIHGPAARSQVADEECAGAGRADRRSHRRDGGGQPAVPRRRAPGGRGGPAGGLALDRIHGRSGRGPGTGPGRGGVGPRTARRQVAGRFSPAARRPACGPARLETLALPLLVCRRARPLPGRCRGPQADRRCPGRRLRHGPQTARAGDGQRRSVSHGQRGPAGRSARHDRGRGGRRRGPCPGHGG